ncbi:MAG: carboxylating nicotinate-nucleotide diphosphorylase, partial [Maritimibacter harenae]
MTYASLPDIVLEPIIRNALMEDLGTYGDVTTRAVIP